MEEQGVIGKLATVSGSEVVLVSGGFSISVFDCTTCRRQVWDPQTLIRKIIIKHKKGFNPKKPCFKNNIFSLAKIVQDYFLSG